MAVYRTPKPPDPTNAMIVDRLDEVIGGLRQVCACVDALGRTIHDTHETADKHTLEEMLRLVRQLDLKLQNRRGE